MQEVNVQSKITESLGGGTEDRHTSFREEIKLPWKSIAWGSIFINSSVCEICTHSLDLGSKDINYVRLRQIVFHAWDIKYLIVD